jgi:DNA-binding transcriptional ArsR family regulator
MAASLDPRALQLREQLRARYGKRLPTPLVTDPMVDGLALAYDTTGPTVRRWLRDLREAELRAEAREARAHEERMAARAEYEQRYHPAWPCLDPLGCEVCNARAWPEGSYIASTAA